MIRSLCMNIYNRVFLSTSPVLGRWTLKHKCKSEDITVIHTTSDHCGDSLCGNPTEIKSKIDSVLNKDKLTTSYTHH